MLPDGMSADLVGFSEQQAFLDHHPEAQTVIRIMRGACSCDLVVERDPDPRKDEAHLRPRYRSRSISRDFTIRALDRHRRGHQRRRRPLAHWTVSLAGFVAEHARNAGPSLYYLQFSAGEILNSPAPGAKISQRTAREVRDNPGQWLPEGELVLVTP